MVALRLAALLSALLTADAFSGGAPFLHGAAAGGCGLQAAATSARTRTRIYAEGGGVSFEARFVRRSRSRSGVPINDYIVIVACACCHLDRRPCVLLSSKETLLLREIERLRD